MGSGPLVHVILIPFFGYYKIYSTESERQRALEVETEELDDEHGKTVIFSIRYTCCQYIYVYSIGLVLNFVSYVIQFLAFFW